MTGPSGAIITLNPTETLFPNEPQIIADAVNQAVASVEKGRKDLGKSMRDAHPKAFGCVRGIFTTDPNRPSFSKIGVFAPDTSYRSWVRFSAANPVPQSDTKPDLMGMAIKLTGVPGNKLIDNKNTAQTQDFLNVHFPVFNVANLQEFTGFLKNPLLYLGTHPRAAILATRAFGKKRTDPAETQYWSMAAYAPGSQAVKYTVIPCSAPQTPNPSQKTDNYLTENLIAHLNSRGACYHFMVQVQKDPQSTPVEDPSIEWQQQDSPFVSMATTTPQDKNPLATKYFSDYGFGDVGLSSSPFM